MMNYGGRLDQTILDTGIWKMSRGDVPLTAEDEAPSRWPAHAQFFFGPVMWVTCVLIWVDLVKAIWITLRSINQATIG